MSTLGKKIADLRKRANYTQEELAEKVGVSSQAVSKWENDLSIPDLPVIINLADVFGVTLDELIRDKGPQTALVDKNIRKPLEQTILRILVNSVEGDKVKVNLPMSLIKAGLKIGMNGNVNVGNVDLSDIDFDQILSLAQEGVIGKLVEVETAEGDLIEIFVE